MDTFRSETANIIESTKEKYLMSQGVKLADQSTGQKTYWKILNEFLNQGGRKLNPSWKRQNLD